LVGGTFEVVGLAKNVLAWLEVLCNARSELFDNAGDIIAEHDWKTAFDIEAPVAHAVLVGIHCRIRSA